MRRSLIWVGCGVVLGGGIVGVLATQAGSLRIGRPQPAVISAGIQRGSVDRYTYAITDIEGENTKLAQFDPAVEPDETKVLAALKAVAKSAYNVDILDTQQPEVETIDETNLVTYSLAKGKIVFELFRDTDKHVEKVRFWRN